MTDDKMNGASAGGLEGLQPLKLLKASTAGVIQLHVQEAHWIAQAAGAQAAQMEVALKNNQVSIQHLRETQAMMNGLKNLSARAVRAFNELAQIEQEKLDRQRAADAAEDAETIDD